MGIFPQFCDFWKRRVFWQKWNKINGNPSKVLLLLHFSGFYKCKKIKNLKKIIFSWIFALLYNLALFCPLIFYLLENKMQDKNWQYH